MKLSLRVFTQIGDWQDFCLDTEPQIEQELVSRFVTELKSQFPGNEFKVIKIGKKRYNVLPLPIANA